MTTVYSYNTAGRLIGPVILTEADMSPLEPGVYLIPGNCTAKMPPVNSPGFFVAWDGDDWGYVSDVTPTEPPTPTPALTVADFDAALTAHLDTTAQSRRYDNRITCAVRAGYSGPFQAEGQAFAAWMDACNAFAYTLLAEVQAGTRPLPDSTQALIDLLPPMVWPA